MLITGIITTYDSKDVIKLGIGLVGTMTALVLGLLISSAKGSFDAQSTELTQASANIVLLDRVLAHYGPETAEIRQDLRVVVSLIDETWPVNRHRPSQFPAGSSRNEFLFEKLQSLSPQNDAQRTLKSQALKYDGEFRADPVADVRAGSRVSLHTNSSSNGVLVDHYFHRVGVVDTSEFHSPCHDVCGRLVSIQRDLSDSGNVQSLMVD